MCKYENEMKLRRGTVRNGGNHHLIILLHVLILEHVEYKAYLFFSENSRCSAHLVPADPILVANEPFVMYCNVTMKHFNVSDFTVKVDDEPNVGLLSLEPGGLVLVVNHTGLPTDYDKKKMCCYSSICDCESCAKLHIGGMTQTHLL